MRASLQGLEPVGRLGRYDLLGRLATGGMAEIYLARETGPHGAGRNLVVKRVLPHVARDGKLIGMFLQEARLVMRLRHPNIVPIFEFGEDEGEFFLAMEWVDGVPLSALVEKRKRLPVPLACKIISDIAGALHHAHTATDEGGHPLGIVHRDVTPENVMIGFDGVPRLLDFGIAKATTQVNKTQAGIIKGKFAYMSPEQYQGQPLDARSDIFSLGVCLYETLAGEHLYARANEYETVAAIVLEEAAPSIRETRPELPLSLDAIVRTSLAKQRDSRFRSADHMQLALQQFLAQGQHIVRDQMIAELVQRAFPEPYRLGPDLDRGRPSLHKPSQHRPSPTTTTGPQELDEVERYALGAELEEEEERIAAAGRRKSLTVGLLAAVIILVTLAVAGFALYDKPASAVPDEPVPGGAP